MNLLKNRHEMIFLYAEKITFIPLRGLIFFIFVSKIHVKSRLCLKINFLKTSSGNPVFYFIHPIPKWRKILQSFVSILIGPCSLPRLMPNIPLCSADGIEETRASKHEDKRLKSFPSFWNKVYIPH